MPSFYNKPWRNAALAGGVVLVVLGAFFFAVGLDDADKYASVIGAIAAVFGVVLSALGLSLRNASGSAPEVRGTQRISGSVVGGRAAQVRGVSGDVAIRGSDTRRPAGPSPEPPQGDEPEGAEGDQVISRSTVEGASIQIDQVGGNVELNGTD